MGVSRLFLIGADTVASVLMPFLNSEKDDDIRLNIFSRYTRIIFTATIIGVFLVIACADLVVPFIYGSDFTASVRPLKILLIGTLFACLTKFFSVYSVITGNIRLNLYSVNIAFIATIALDFLLIPKYGIIGASIANACSSLVLFTSLIIAQYLNKILVVKNYFLITLSDIKLMISQSLEIRDYIFQKM